MFDEDLSEFLHDDEHAEEATIVGIGTVLGIWRDGYVATLVAGTVIQRDGVDTGARPGHLVRGAQPRP